MAAAVRRDGPLAAGRAADPLSRCRLTCWSRKAGERSWRIPGRPGCVALLTEPFPGEDPLPGAYRLQLPSDGLTLWYTVTDSPQGQVVIVVPYVKAGT